MIEVIDQYGTRHRFDDNHCIHSESKHQVQVGLQNGDEYEVVATFPYPAMYGRVTEMDCLSLRESPAGVVRQLNKLEAKNTQLGEDLAAAQAVIEQMRGVIGAWERADGNEELQEAEAKLIKAMNTKNSLDALHEARALECERLAKTHGVGVMKWLCEEAAAHRARKQATKEEGK